MLEKFSDLKERLEHGQWLPWLKGEFGWSRQTAVSFMQVYECFKCQNFGQLEVDVSALYLITAPSTPEPVRGATMKLPPGTRVIFPGCLGRLFFGEVGSGQSTAAKRAGSFRECWGRAGAGAGGFGVGAGRSGNAQASRWDEHAGNGRAV
jgi:hypothetical protein